jgi:hypothetical protein
VKLSEAARAFIRNEETPVSAKEIKLVYIILAHSDPRLFGRLLERLRDKRAAFVVHLDAKAQLEPFEAEVNGRTDVFFIKPSLRVMWAGVSQVMSTLISIEQALKITTPNCSHIVILSGADYPIASNEEIFNFFREHKDRQFIRRFSLMDCGDTRQLWRVRGLHFREWADRFTWKRKPLFAIEQFLHVFPRKVPAGITLALGSNWVAITRDCAKFCINKSLEEPYLLNFLKYSFGPDEIYLHTLVENSPFANQAPPIEPYHDITKIGGPFYYANVHALVPRVPIRTKEEAEMILAHRGNKLFTRKLSSIESGAALEIFDNYISSAPTRSVDSRRA